jgi:hypothetical protein
MPDAGRVIMLTHTPTEDEQRAIDAWPAVWEMICRSPALGAHDLIRIRITGAHAGPRELSEAGVARLLAVLREEWDR